MCTAQFVNTLGHEETFDDASRMVASGELSKRYTTV